MKGALFAAFAVLTLCRANAAEPASPAALFEQALGAPFQEFFQNLRTEASSPSSVEFRVLSHDEPEVRSCPKGAQELQGKPDPDLYTYIGFRYVRSDGSTCSDAPTDRIFYQEPQSQGLSFKGSPEGDPSSFRYDLTSPEYKIRRNFYFRTQLDGTRRFYSHDFRQHTGKKIPETVLLEFANRETFPLLPWEAPEIFRLAYGRPAGAEVSPVTTGYEYALDTAVGRAPDGGLLTTVRLAALRKKTLTPPDKEAVSLTPANERRKLILTVQDKWARYYKGEKLGLKIRIWRNRFLIGDKLAYEIEAALDPAAQIRIHPADPAWDPFKKEPIKEGSEYYAEWSFQRAGSRISTGDWIEKGKTNRVKLEDPPEGS